MSHSDGGDLWWQPRCNLVLAGNDDDDDDDDDDDLNSTTTAGVSKTNFSSTGWALKTEPCLTVCNIFVSHVQNALYFRRKMRALWRTLSCERTSRFSRFFILPCVSLPRLDHGRPQYFFPGEGKLGGLETKVSQRGSGQRCSGDPHRKKLWKWCINNWSTERFTVMHKTLYNISRGGASATLPMPAVARGFNSFILVRWECVVDELWQNEVCGDRNGDIDDHRQHVIGRRQPRYGRTYRRTRYSC